MDNSSIQKTFFRRELKPPCIDFCDPKEGRLYFLDALKHGCLEGYFPLSSQFQSQSHYAFCGISSLSMSLNTLLIDPGRIYSGVWRWWEDGMLNSCQPLDEVRIRGITLPKLACLSRCSGVTTSLIYASNITYEQFYSDIFKACSTICSEKRPIIIASYSRKVLNQTGDGHYSPIGAYSPTYNQVLVLDVARFKYPPYWVDVQLLYESMQQIDSDTGKSRGYLMLKRGSGMQQHIESLCRCDNGDDNASCSDNNNPTTKSDDDIRNHYETKCEKKEGKKEEVSIPYATTIDDCSDCNKDSTNTQNTTTTTTSKKEKEKEREKDREREREKVHEMDEEDERKSKKQKIGMESLEKEVQELKDRLQAFTSHNRSDCNCEFCSTC